MRRSGMRSFRGSLRPGLLTGDRSRLDRRGVGWALALSLMALVGCRHAMPAPYARGQAPGVDLLLERTEAQLTALQVSKAKVIANRTLRGNLAFIAEVPGRFRGSVDVAGNELVTLSFHEQGYALRYKMEAFPQGFYEGPPSACAVEALLGVAFDTEGLVDLVLGGAPVIDGPHQVLDQRWDKRGGYERLTIANGRFVQELRFGWIDGQWRVMGGQLWERAGQGKGRRLWTVEHIALEVEKGVHLPTKTKVSTPGKRRDDTVVINYKERDPDPMFAKRRSPSGGDGGGDGGDGDPWENGDPWEDEGGWEDEDEGGWEGEDEGGWEGEDGAAPAGDAPAEGTKTDGAASGETEVGSPPEAAGAPGEAASEAAPPVAETESPADTSPSSELPAAKSPPAKSPPAKSPPAKSPPAKSPAPETEPAIPPEFQLEPSGLVPRGDLCRNAR